MSEARILSREEFTQLLEYVENTDITPFGINVNKRVAQYLSDIGVISRFAATGISGRGIFRITDEQMTEAEAKRKTA